MAARAVVFGQASALVAALVAGMYGGIGVIAAALFLEHVCKLPEDDDEGPNRAPAA
jgi:hypothetical protein